MSPQPSRLYNRLVVIDKSIMLFFDQDVLLVALYSLSGAGGRTPASSVGDVWFVFIVEIARRL